jgi:hypothetical protein
VTVCIALAEVTTAKQAGLSEVCMKEHKHHLMILKKSKLAQHAYNEGDKL